MPICGRKPDQRREEGLQPGRVDALVEDPGDRAAEAVKLVFLAGESLDDADAGDVLLGLRGQLGDPLLHLLQRWAGDAVVARGGEDDEWRRRQRDQRQQRVDHDHHRAGEDDRQQALGDEDQAVAEEEADRLQVDRRPRHQLSGLLGVEEAQLQSLKVRVEELAQVEFDREGDLAGDQPSHHGQPHPQHARPDDRQREREQVGLVEAFDRVDRRGRSATGSAPSSPSPARRRPATPKARGGRGAGSPSGGGNSPSTSLYKVKYWSRDTAGGAGLRCVRLFERRRCPGAGDHALLAWADCALAGRGQDLEVGDAVEGRSSSRCYWPG